MKSKKPNILLVFTDQQRFDTIAALGNNIIKTPVLDRFIERGVAFTRAYTPCPVCVPARFTMHTGLMPHQTGVTDNMPIPEGKKSYMQLLSENGYQTFGVGKMHFTFRNKDPEVLKWGFDKLITNDSPDLEKNSFYQSLKAAGYGYVYDYLGVRSEMYYVPQVSQLPAHLHHTHWTASTCIDLLKERDRDKPFFAMVSFEKPHPPFEPPAPWNKLYRGPMMPLPKRTDRDEDLTTIWNRFQNRYKYRDNGTDDNLIRQMKAYYYAEISYIDYNLGRLLSYLDNEGESKNTMIIYTADHGELLGDYNCFGKRCFLDSAARIPMLLYYPGCPSGFRVEQPSSLIDVLPTILHYAGIDVNEAEAYEGKSLIDMAEGRVDRDTVFGQFRHSDLATYMAVDSDYKYIYSVPDAKEYLFDVKRDPLELENRASNSFYIKITEKMRKKAISYFTEAEYDKAVENGEWKHYPKYEFNPGRDEYLLVQEIKESKADIPGYTDDTFNAANQENRWLGKRLTF